MDVFVQSEHKADGGSPGFRIPIRKQGEPPGGLGVLFDRSRVIISVEIRVLRRNEIGECYVVSDRILL